MAACYRGASTMCKNGSFKESFESCNLLLEQKGLSKIRRGEIYRWRAGTYKISQALAAPLTKAQIKKNATNYRKKIEDYGKAIDNNPKDFTSYNLIAYVYSFQGKKKKALVEFRKLIGLDSKNPDHYRGVATILDNLNRNDEAVVMYKKGNSPASFFT